MGYSIAWIAFRRKTKEEVLAATRLVDTGEPDEAREAPISGATLPGGWYLLWLNECFHPFVEAAALKRLSENCEVLGCQADEHVMGSAAFLYENGQRLWNVTHEASNGIRDLAVEGAPPEFFGALREEFEEKQAREDGHEASVDFIFDIPIELASKLCGYRYDKSRIDWGQPDFTVLQMRN